ncbi:breast cancer anti-estrogen resistance protein 3 homolog [Clavelina lepadiformis]|uniref:breast cancer anti-estrogen resistance protein 3 homolog n=1 Tax=Clavelina lepadiformis TaxID=159417 RepID=UPI0040418F08
MYQELKPGGSRSSRDGKAPVKISSEMLRRSLGSELQLDNHDVRSHGWYHGRLPRNIAEELLRQDGDFLVRESLSNAGENVLTMMWQDTVLHFKINKVILQPSASYSKLQYGFERDSFDSIPALIMFHIGSSAPISDVSGAIIKRPVNRKLPLSYSDSQHSKLEANVLGNKSISESIVANQRNNPFPVLENQQSFMSRPLSQVELNVINHSKVVDRVGSDPLLNTAKRISSETDDTLGALPKIKKSSQQNSVAVVPPKPSRVPSFRRPVIRHAEHNPPENLQYNSLKNSRVNMSVSEGMVSPRSKAFPDARNVGATTSPRSVTSLLGASNEAHPQTSPLSKTSVFKPLLYSSSLLPDQNKPVEGPIMLEIKNFLVGNDPFKLARHMTAIDCEICKINDLGLEELLLPNGGQLRKDIMERYQCLSFWVALCVLRSGVNLQEKVDVLNVFIQVANELVHSVGNLFGFSAIMHGLMCPQLSALSELWDTLQKRYTNNAVTLHKKLYPLMRMLDEGKAQFNLELVCIPHLLPVLRYLENPLTGIPHSSPSKLSNFSQSPSSKVETDYTLKPSVDNALWWQNLPDDSFDTLLAQLSLAREIMKSCLIFRKNSTNKLRDVDKKMKFHEMFTTDFQLRLMWGYKGVDSPKKERYEKFDKVITLMAKRITS